MSRIDSSFNSEKKTDATKNIMAVLLGINIFYQIFYNSSWRTEYVATYWKGIGYGLLFLMLLVTLLYFSFVKIRLSRIVYFSILIILIILTVMNDNLSVALVPVFALSAYFLDFKKLIKSYLIATILAVSLVFFMSLIGVLPYRDSLTGYIDLGFKNPNTTGFYIAIIAIELLMVIYNNHKVLSLSYYVISVILESYLFHDSTAVMMSIIFIFLFYVCKFRESWLHSKVIFFISALIPSFLAISSFEIAKNYNYSPLYLQLNDILTNRAFLWHYYFVNYPPKLFMQSIDINTVGLSAVPGNGAFDGAYVSFLVYNGYILLGLFVGLLTLLIWRSLKYKQTLLFIFSVTVILSGFTEGLLFSAFQSPVIVIATLIINQRWGETLNYE